MAEGIEVRDDLDRLRDYPNIAGQGYLFARPMPAGDIGRFRGALGTAEADHVPLRTS